MGVKILDFLSFYYEKKMKSEGYSIRRDENKKIKVALRMRRK